MAVTHMGEKLCNTNKYGRRCIESYILGEKKVEKPPT